MALASWKAFRFFDVNEIRVPANDGPSLEPGSFTCIAAGQNNIFVGSPDGHLRLLNQSFKTVQSFKVHESSNVTHITPVPNSSYLVTLSEDLSNEPELKVWALDKPEKKTGIPKCLSTVSVQNGRRQFPVSAFAVLPDLSQIAVGFANGSVTIIRGDFIHDRGTKQRTVLDGDEPITALEFRPGGTTSLFIGTAAKILTLVISGKGQGQPAKTLDEHGCAVGCMIRNPQTKDILVARDDAVYSYNLRGRGASFAFEGGKKLVSTLRDYIMFVSPPENTAKSRSTPLRAFGVGAGDELYNTTKFSIIDPDLKIIAHTETLPSQISHIFAAWQMIFLITQEGKVLRYQEKTFAQKLELLYQRDYYVLAINLAQKESVDPVQQNIIFRKYGDYLYSKGDYDTAMQQYLRAIDNTEPSHIIRKFLDNQRIQNLIDYLEELHEHGKASSDHTTLLLNCYAKLKDVEKLEAFIRQPGELKFDLDTAIAMCRQGGYPDQAAFLARKHDEHGLVIDILIEDLRKYPEAMAYILRLEPTLAYENGMKYATVLLEHAASDETQFLIDYYTGVFRTRKDAIVEQETPVAQPGYASRATTAVQNLASMIPLPYMSTDFMRSSTKESGEKTVMSQQVVETVTEAEFVEYTVPKPRTAFAAFVDHPDQFIEFLEACIDSPDIGDEDKTDLYGTLFEMYLAKAKDRNGADADDWTTKAKSLIEQNSVPLSPSSVLLLSSLASFPEGTQIIKERQRQYVDIFRSYTSAHDTQGAIKALRKYGPEAPELYPAALAYFTSSTSILSESRAEIASVLTKIDAERLMAPLQVIQALSQSSVADMGLIKTYLAKTVDKERDEIASNKRLVASYRADTAGKLNDLAALNERPTSFSATRCSTCGTPLDLPVVHFLCRHSFHQRCLNVAGEDEEEAECPVCAPGNATLKAIRRAQVESAGRGELFLDAVARSRDRFGTVAEWFGRGVMDAGGVES
ncbi:vacuolar protein sorting-associated protein 11 [Myriangium duriaei CBS 260.36]|uniref:E3 ubiquitin-protein ligase PEP5 n=1 Tax=Myriangium duriaei CBS 260.36 TaxID=1168546 RepID=A0A9P4IUL7_9PEZI|nr:vacuolar protein sorting-associated protein 11 [Myriangium duriaei CBS 260.36]